MFFYQVAFLTASRGSNTHLLTMDMETFQFLPRLLQNNITEKLTDLQYLLKLSISADKIVAKTAQTTPVIASS